MITKVGYRDLRVFSFVTFVFVSYGSLPVVFVFTRNTAVFAVM